MGQDSSKPATGPGGGAGAATHPRHADPATTTVGPDGGEEDVGGRHGSSGAASHDDQVEAELRRMLRVSSVAERPAGVAGADSGPHVVRARELQAELSALPPPRPPMVASSLDGFMLNRHDRTVEEINKRTPAMRGAVPNPSDVHRALAALQTHDLAHADFAADKYGRLVDCAKAAAYQTQLLKSLALRTTHDVHRAVVALGVECDGLALAVHGAPCRPQGSPSSSPMRPTSASNVAPDVSPRHQGLVHLAAETAALARQVDALLSAEDRAAVKDMVAAMPATTSAPGSAARGGSAGGGGGDRIPGSLGGAASRGGSTDTPR